MNKKQLFLCFFFLGDPFVSRGLERNLSQKFSLSCGIADVKHAKIMSHNSKSHGTALKKKKKSFKLYMLHFLR